MSIKFPRFVDQDVINQYIADFVKDGKFPKIQKGNLMFPIKGKIIINPDTGELNLLVD